MRINSCGHLREMLPKCPTVCKTAEKQPKRVAERVGIINSRLCEPEKQHVKLLGIHRLLQALFFGCLFLGCCTVKPLGKPFQKHQGFFWGCFRTLGILCRISRRDCNPFVGGGGYRKTSTSPCSPRGNAEKGGGGIGTDGGAEFYFMCEKLKSPFFIARNRGGIGVSLKT